jgi:hypothetical protein
VFAATQSHTRRIDIKCGSSAATITSVAGVAPVPFKYNPRMAIINSPQTV